jgi:hypothetical protein
MAYFFQAHDDEVSVFIKHEYRHVYGTELADTAETATHTLASGLGP